MKADTNLNNSDNECDYLDSDNNISKEILSEADNLNNNTNYYDSPNNQINDVLDLSDIPEENLLKDMNILDENVSTGNEVRKLSSLVIAIFN